MKALVPRVRKPPRKPTTRPQYVYRLTDRHGKTLYIGRSVDPLARLRAHLGWDGLNERYGIDHWPGQVAQIDAWGPYRWEDAVKRERAAILSEKPLHNSDGVRQRGATA